MTIKKNTSQIKRAAAKTDRKRGFQRFMKTHWTVGDFMLQLATVIIGILVTFGGSALIQKRAEQKATERILSMVRNELQDNLSRIGLQKALLAHEWAGTKAMKPYVNIPEAMPTDSLNKYIDVIMRVRNYGHLTTSFEVLKSSSQIETIDNKELIRDLFTAYMGIDEFSGGVKFYNSLREDAFSDIFSAAESDFFDDIFLSDERTQILFAEAMKNSLFRNYLVSTANGNNVSGLIPSADYLVAELTKVIEQINKEIGIK